MFIIRRKRFYIVRVYTLFRGIGLCDRIHKFSAVGRRKGPPPVLYFSVKVYAHSTIHRYRINVMRISCFPPPFPRGFSTTPVPFSRSFGSPHPFGNFFYIYTSRRKTTRWASVGRSVSRVKSLEKTTLEVNALVFRSPVFPSRRPVARILPNIYCDVLNCPRFYKKKKKYYFFFLAKSTQKKKTPGKIIIILL